jgi:hypothetical protein
MNKSKLDYCKECARGGLQEWSGFRGRWEVNLAERRGEMRGNDGAKWPGREKLKVELWQGEEKKRKRVVPEGTTLFFKRELDPYLPANSITWAVKGLANRMIMATTKT